MAYKWTIEKMVTQDRAAIVAAELFPEEYQGENCRNEVGREGELCTFCLHREKQWQERITQVRAAMIKAFS